MAHIKRLLFLLLVAFSIPAWASISLVQAPAFTAGNPTSGTTLTNAFGSNNTAGNTLIAVFYQSYDPGENDGGITDSQTNTWFKIGCSIQTSPHVRGCIFYAPNCKSGANTVTVTFPNSSTYTILSVMEYGGLLTTDTLDQYQFASGTSSPRTTLNVAPVAGSNDLLLGFAIKDYQITGTWSGATSGFTQRGSFNSTTNGGQMVIYDDENVSAGTYNWSIANSNVNRSLHIGLVAFRAVSPSLGSLQTAIGQAASTSVSATLPFNPTIGNTLMLTLAPSNGSVAGLAFSGCGSPTWNSAGFTFPNVSVQGAVYLATVNSSSACTVTATVTTSTTLSMTLNEYAGVITSYPVEGVAPYISVNSPASYGSINTVGSNDLILHVIFANSMGNCTALGGSSGWGTVAQLCQNNASAAVGVFQTTGNAGSYAANPTFTDSSGSGQSQVLLALRSAVPSPGVLQTACNSSSASTVSTSFPYSFTSGDTVMAYGVAGSDGGGTPPLNYVPAVTDSLSDSYIAMPSINFAFYAPNVTGGNPTVTATSTSSQNYILCIAELHGVGAATPFYASTIGYNLYGQYPIGSGTGAPITTPAGSYLLVSILSNLSYSGNIFGASGWAPQFPYIGPTYNGNIWYGVQTSAGTYSNALTTAYSSDYVQQNFAFSASNVTTARIVQSITQGGNHTTTRTRPFLGPLTAGQMIVVYLNQLLASGTLPTISDTQGNSFTLLQGGTSATSHALWIATAGSSGADSITTVCANECSFGAVAVSTVNAVDCSNAAWNTSATSLSDGGCTNTNTNDLAISLGSLDGHTHAQMVPSGSWTNWSNWSSSEQTSEFFYSQYITLTGSNTNTWTTSTSGQMGAAILLLKEGSPVPPPSGSQPIINLITELDQGQMKHFTDAALGY